MFPIRYVHKVKGHPSLQKGGCHEVHDIEDLVKVGQVVKGPVSLLSRLKCISLKDKNLYVTVSCMRCGPVYYVVWPMNLWRSIWIMFKRQLYPKYQSGAPSHTRFSLREIIMKSLKVFFDFQAVHILQHAQWHKKQNWSSAHITISSIQ